MFLPDTQSVGGEQTKRTTAGRTQSAQSHNLGMKWTEYTKRSHNDESAFDFFLSLLVLVRVLEQAEVGI